LYKDPTPTIDHLEARETMLSLVIEKFLSIAQESLALPLTEQKLEDAVTAMVRGKSPSCDNIAIEFCTKYWSFIGTNFFEMVQDSIIGGRFPA